LQDSLESQGNFVAEGNHDILVEAIGRPEHCGRVRAAGQGVEIKLYFGVSQRKSSFSSKESKAEMKTKIREELMEEMRKETDLMRLEMRKKNDQMRQVFLSQQLCTESIQPLVIPTPKSTKGSCAAPTTSRDDIIGQTRECELLVAADKLPRVVALGKVYEEATTLHNVPLSPDVAKVTVEKVRVPDARVPLPSDEITTVVDAFQTFVSWLRHLIRFMPQPHVIISFHYINLYLYLYITYNLIQMFFIM